MTRRSKRNDNKSNQPQLTAAEKERISEIDVELSRMPQGKFGRANWNQNLKLIGNPLQQSEYAPMHQRVAQAAAVVGALVVATALAMTGVGLMEMMWGVKESTSVLEAIPDFGKGVATAAVPMALVAAPVVVASRKMNKGPGNSIQEKSEALGREKVQIQNKKPIENTKVKNAEYALTLMTGALEDIGSVDLANVHKREESLKYLQEFTARLDNFTNNEVGNTAKAKLDDFVRHSTKFDRSALAYGNMYDIAATNDNRNVTIAELGAAIPWDPDVDNPPALTRNHQGQQAGDFYIGANGLFVCTNPDATDAFHANQVWQRVVPTGDGHYKLSGNNIAGDNLAAAAGGRVGANGDPAITRNQFSDLFCGRHGHAQSAAAAMHVSTEFNNKAKQHFANEATNIQADINAGVLSVVGAAKHSARMEEFDAILESSPTGITKLSGVAISGSGTRNISAPSDIASAVLIKGELER